MAAKKLTVKNVRSAVVIRDGHEIATLRLLHARPEVAFERRQTNAKKYGMCVDRIAVFRFIHEQRVWGRLVQ